MNANQVYEFLVQLKLGSSYTGAIFQCFDNKRSGVWNDTVFNAVKQGLQLYWSNKEGFEIYLGVWRGLVC